jgi:hypothetical protein
VTPVYAGMTTITGELGQRDAAPYVSTGK